MFYSELNHLYHIHRGNYESTKIADHILEMAGIGLFYDFFECRKLFLRVKGDFKVINQFILFPLS